MFTSIDNVLCSTIRIVGFTQETSHLAEAVNYFNSWSVIASKKYALAISSFINFYELWNSHRIYRSDLELVMGRVPKTRVPGGSG